MYAQHDPIPGDTPYENLTPSLAYEAGVEMGWKLAEAFHGLAETPL